MASESQLLQALKDLLHMTGHMRKLQADVKSKITEALSHHQSPCPDDEVSSPPPAPGDVALLNELVREYLEWNGYLFTANILTTEAGLREHRPSRMDICVEVGVKDDEKSVSLPLLSSIVAAYTDRIKRKMSRTHK